MKQISSDTEEIILRRLIEGATYRQIAREFSVSTSTVNSVMEKNRNKIRDIDELRKLSTTLNKQELSVFEAVRGSRLLERLNECGISADDLEEFITLTQQLLPDQPMREQVMTYSAELLRLEETTGRNYQEVVADFEKKSERIAELEKTIDEHQKRIRKLDLEKAAADKRLKEIFRKTARATATYEGLQKAGADELDKLVDFVKYFDSKKIGVQELIRVAEARQELEKMGVDPDRLCELVRHKGQLESEIQKLEYSAHEMEQTKSELTESLANLASKNKAFTKLNGIWERKTIKVTCAKCDHTCELPADYEFYVRLINAGQLLTICPCCDATGLDPRIVLLELIRSLLPPSTTISPA